MSPRLAAAAHGPAPVELYEFTQGENAWRYTSADTAVLFRGETYTPCEIIRGEVRHTQEATSGTLELKLPKANAVAQLYMGFLPPTPVRLRVYRAQRQDLQFYVVFAGRIASVSFPGAQATVTCASLEESLQRTVPGVVLQSQCNWVLFGQGCGLSAAAWRDEGIVTRVDGQTLWISVRTARAEGWYVRGYVLAASGERRRIESQAGFVFTVNAPFRDLAAGETVSLWPGCDHTEADCDNKDNLTNHMGFPRMPERNPFTGTA